MTQMYTQLGNPANDYAVAADILEGKPIDMVLHCPACHMQHIDAPDDPDCNEVRLARHREESAGRPYHLWTNPPHRSHKCAGCGYIWRPADIPTNGVKETKTKGQNDGPPPMPYINPWKEAIIEACVVNCIGWDENDPTKTLMDLIKWEIQIQTDPAIGGDRVLKSSSKVRDTGGSPYAVSQDQYWRYDSAPRGVKVFLLNAGGVAIAPGPWRDDAGYIGWHPLFKRDKAEEERRGLT